MLLLKIIILFLFIFFALAIIGQVFGGFWVFVALVFWFLQAYEEWTR